MWTDQVELLQPLWTLKTVSKIALQQHLLYKGSFTALSFKRNTNSLVILELHCIKYSKNLLQWRILKLSSNQSCTIIPPLRRFHYSPLTLTQIPLDYLTTKFIHRPGTFSSSLLYRSSWEPVAAMGWMAGHEGVGWEKNGVWECDTVL